MRRSIGINWASSKQAWRRLGEEAAMDIGESHMILAYGAVIGIHAIYLIYVVTKFVRSGKRVRQG